jgi:hypothetical protein
MGDAWRIERTPTKESSEGPGNDDIILVDGEILEDSKPAAQPSKKDTRLAGQQRAWEWAKQQFNRPYTNSFIAQCDTKGQSIETARKSTMWATKT